MSGYKFLTCTSKVNSYIPVPMKLLRSKLGSTTLLVYGLLLGRATLSQKNNWTDDSKRIFIIYPKLSESIRKAKNRKDYQEQITHNGNDATPGVKDWYTFKKEFSDGDRETIIECQRQNGFWTGKMSKWKMIITVIIGIVLFFVLWYEIQKHQLKVLPCLVGVVALVMKLIERVLVNLKYIKAFEKIEGATENTRLNGNDEQIRAVQSRIDELRSIPVFGINFVHKNLANYYTNLYDEIQKSR